MSVRIMAGTTCKAITPEKGLEVQCGDPVTGWMTLRYSNPDGSGHITRMAACDYHKDPYLEQKSRKEFYSRCVCSHMRETHEDGLHCLAQECSCKEFVQRTEPVHA